LPDSGGSGMRFQIFEEVRDQVFYGIRIDIDNNTRRRLDL